jgi:hypothetical protein
MPLRPPELGLYVDAVLRPQVTVVVTVVITGARAKVVVACLRRAQRRHGLSHGLLGRCDTCPSLLSMLALARSAPPSCRSRCSASSASSAARGAARHHSASAPAREAAARKSASERWEPGPTSGPRREEQPASWISCRRVSGSVRTGARHAASSAHGSSRPTLSRGGGRAAALGQGPRAHILDPRTPSQLRSSRQPKVERSGLEDAPPAGSQEEQRKG